MDSQERHELKQNDLQDFLENFGGFWKKWGNTILTTIAVLIIIFAGSKLYNDWQYSAKESAWVDLAGATSPQSADMVANEHSNPTVQALAFLKAGDLFLAEASKPEPAEQRVLPVDGGGDPVEQERAQMLDNAASRYTTVLDLDVPLVYPLNAKLGLAAVAENREAWDEAAGLYQQVIDQAGDRHATLSALAKAKMDMLPQLKRPVVFGPDPDQQADPALTPALDSTPAPAMGDAPSIGDIFSASPDALEVISVTPDDDANNDTTTDPSHNDQP